MINKFKFRLIVAIAWLLAIYLFLPLGPSIFNFLCKQCGYSSIRRILAIASILAVLLVYVPFIKKFNFKNIIPYVIITPALSLACVINLSLKAAARTLHIPEYAILSILLFRVFSSKFSLKKRYTIALVGGFSAGIIDERFIQFLLPMRYYDPTDILLNSTGVILGLCLMFAYNLSSE